MRRLIVAVVVAWAGIAFLAELRRAYEGYDGKSSFVATHPLIWRFGTAEPERLERCLARAARRVQPGSRIAFLSPDGQGGVAFFRWRWAAYFLPAHHVVPEIPEGLEVVPDAVVAFDQGFADPRFAAVERRRGCRIYLPGLPARPRESE